MSKLPKPHQQNAIINGVKHFEDADRGQLIMPCGSGKSLTALWLTQALNAKRIIVALPTLTLQSQTIETWLRELSQNQFPFEILLIGSSDLMKAKYNIHTTTDGSKISDFIRDNASKDILIITTYSSSQLLAGILKDNGFGFDLIIFDEAHRTAGKDKSSFQSLLDNGLSIKKRLFMTATPKTFSNSHEFDDVKSMDDQKIYGKTFYKLSIPEAIKLGVIVDYKIVTLLCQNNELVTAITEKYSDTRLVMIAVQIIKAIDQLKLNKVIAYSSTIQRASEFMEILTTVAQVLRVPINAFTVSSKQSDKVRDHLLYEFTTNPNSIITNARILGEGVDIPAVDAVVFVDERSSNGDIVQICGRAWRTDKNKQFGYILLPCVVDTYNSIDTDDSNLMIKVLTALGCNDERILDFTKSDVEPEQIKNQIEFVGDTNPKVNLIDVIEQVKLAVWKNISRFNFDGIKWGKIADDYVDRLCNNNIAVLPEYHVRYIRGSLYKLLKQQGKRIDLHSDEAMEYYDVDFASFLPDSPYLINETQLQKTRQLLKWKRNHTNIKIAGPIQLSYIRGLRYNECKSQGRRTDLINYSDNNVATLVELFNVSYRTLKRDSQLAIAIEMLDNEDSELKEIILTGRKMSTPKRKIYHLINNLIEEF
jgi:predicted helicase